MSPTVLDVLDASDLRFAGGTSASLVEEIRAQARAGWRTGLAHLPGPLVARATPVHPGLRDLVDQGAAQLVLDEEVTAGVVVLRHPAVVQHALDALPRVNTEHVVVVANAVPRDVDGHRHYDPAVVHRMLTERFGRAPRWAPISPAVRAAIAGDLSPADLLPRDWVNVVDLDAWAPTRESRGARGTGQPRHERPIIGRHSRPAASKWPTDPSTLRAVYPTDGSMHVRVLGGAEPARRLLGAVPASWTVLPFGAVTPQEFLGGLDVFVYFHDPTMVEGFGRTVLEAIAAGVPAVVPPPFREVFGEAVLAVETGEVRATVLALHADDEAYDAQVTRALTVARERFGHEAHVGRIAQLLGAEGHDGARTGSATGPGAPPTPNVPSTPSAPSTAPFGVRNAAARVVRRRVLPWLRSRSVVERVARKVLLTQDVPAPTRSAAVGSVVVGLGAAELPVVLVVAAGLTADVVERVERDVAEAQLLGAGFRPVLVTDPGLPPLGRFGYTREHLPEPVGTPGDGLRTSLADLVTAYGASSAVVAGADGLDVTAMALLGALGGR